MPAEPVSVEVTSVVPAPPAAVWARVTTLDGVNAELWPLLRMTAPPGVTLDDAPLDRPYFRSRLLLGGRVPIGVSHLTLVHVDPGRGFLERSPMTGMAVWEHERTLEAHGDGTLVRDRLRGRTRVAVPAPVVAAVVRAFFTHRHRRLRRAFGGA